MASSSQQNPRGQSSSIMSSRQHMTHSADTMQRLRNEESWVEISSQPSSSSLSSIGDEIVTTGLRVNSAQQSPLRSPTQARRRRRSRNSAITASRIGQAGIPTSTSSQDEYEESTTESEDDNEKVMTSSNEQIHITPFARVPPISGSSQAHDDTGEESDDENATALASRTSRHANEPFTPQPNAFSHPPSSRTHLSAGPVPGSYFPLNTHSNGAPHRQSYHGRSSSSRHFSHNIERGNTNHGPYSHVSPSHDHDAALRASLTTLLSCAAAARGLPKRETHTTAGPSADFTGFRLVPESEVMGEPRAPPPASTVPRRNGSSPSVSSTDHTKPFDSENKRVEVPEIGGFERGERKAPTTTTGVKAGHGQKKKRLGNTGAVTTVVTDDVQATVSPTLLTWVVSAGVVVLVSVVGFGAGYAMGREVGRREGMEMAGVAMGFGSGGAAESCASEAVGIGRGVGASMSESVGGLRRVGWGRGRGIVA